MNIKIASVSHSNSLGVVMTSCARDMSVDKGPPCVSFERDAGQRFVASEITKPVHDQTQIMCVILSSQINY